MNRPSQSTLTDAVRRAVALALWALCALGMLGFGTLAAAPAASAETSAECTASQELDRYRLLRRLSLDLRHSLPSYEEYLALDDVADPDDHLKATASAWTTSDAFRVAMRRFHESLLWPNLTGVQLIDLQWRVSTARNGGDRYSGVSAARRRTYRRGNGTEICGDFEQTAFDADGRPIVPLFTPDDGSPAFYQDGWVLVRPYWAPDTEIKVCAFDAQDAATGQRGDACNTSKAIGDPTCGCGPDLRWCFGDGVDATLWAAMREAVLRLVDDVTVGGKPYTDLLTTRRAYHNGALDFWMRHQAPIASFARTYNPPGPGAPDVPDAPDYTDASWRQVERGEPHSGILTLPGFALRFQTNRGRANRFRQVFTGQWFNPPAAPDTEGCDDTAADLTERCTCRHCHQVLEPLAAYFGPVAEAGSGIIDLPTYEPACDPNLVDPVPRQCGRFYAVDEGAYNAGTLYTHQFADGDDALHQQIAANLVGGPGALAASSIDTGLLALAAVKNLWRYLMGREPILDPSDPDNEVAIVTDLTDDFQASWDFQALAQALVLLPAYRRIR